MYINLGNNSAVGYEDDIPLMINDDVVPEMFSDNPDTGYLDDEVIKEYVINGSDYPEKI